MVEKEEEEVKGEEYHNHPPVLDGGHVDEFDGFNGII